MFVISFMVIESAEDLVEEGESGREDSTGDSGMTNSSSENSSSDM